MEVEVPAAGSPESSSVQAAVSPAQAAVQQQILGAVMEECLLNSRAEVRRCCCCCLVCCCCCYCL